MKNTKEAQQRSKQRQTGIAMVEYAITLPVVLLLIIATGELGRGFMQFNTLTQTLRDGARYAAEVATTSGGTTGVTIITAADRTAIQNLVVYGNTAGTGNPKLPGFAPGNVTVVGNPTGDVDVSAAYTYQPVFSFIPTFGNGDIGTAYTFRAEINMRAL